MKKEHAMIIAGAVMILAVSVLQGFPEAAVHAAEHVVKDLTDELAVHVYIAGVVLIVAGVAYRFRD